MNILDYIRARVQHRRRQIIKSGDGGAVDWRLSDYKYGETIYLNAVEILTDIYSEVEWHAVAGLETRKFKAWKTFLQYNGQRLLTRLFFGDGYTVIGWRITTDGEFVFWEMRKREYQNTTEDGVTICRPLDESVSCYVLKSPTFDSTGCGDYEYCKPYIKLLDNLLNGANTVAERLGAVVLMSPSQDPQGMVSGELRKEEKEELEGEIQKDYGMLHRQRSLMILRRPMDAHVINLAGLDSRLNEKAKLAICAICDRIKVPANQISILDVQAARSLSNGGELHEGDLAKYRNFRRLLNATYYDMAVEIGLHVDYTIENEPKTTDGENIEQQ